MSKKCTCVGTREDVCSPNGCKDCDACIELGDFDTLEAFMRYNVVRELVDLVRDQEAKLDVVGGDYTKDASIIVFESRGKTILNPLLDEVGREVDPFEYYGEAFINAWGTALGVSDDDYEEPSVIETHPKVVLTVCNFEGHTEEVLKEWYDSSTYEAFEYLQELHRSGLYEIMTLSDPEEDPKGEVNSLGLYYRMMVCGAGEVFYLEPFDCRDTDERTLRMTGRPVE